MQSRAPSSHRPTGQPPSGLFPTGPSRPSLREPHPVRSGAVIAGGCAAALWMVLLAVVATSTRSYVWLTVLGAAVAWACAMVLAWFGDRGAAVGVAIVTGIAVSVAVVVAFAAWIGSGAW